MKATKIHNLIAMIATAGLVLAAAGCGGAESGPQSSNQISIVDSTGREVVLDGPAETIAFSSSFTAEAIKAVGAWDLVVGRDGYMTDVVLYPNLLEIPAVSSPLDQYDLNYEIILELHPDIFIAPYTEDNRPGLETIIERLEPEIPVVALDFYDPVLTAESIRKLGVVVGREEQAERFAGFYEGIEDFLSETTALIPVEERPLVLYQLGYSPDSISTFTNQMPAVQYQFDVVGSRNIAGDFPGAWIESVDREWLITANPEVIFVSLYDFSTPGILGFDIASDAAAEELYEQILLLDVYAGSDAVADRRVYFIHSDLTAGPRFIVGLSYLAKWFHPDLLQEFDPDAISRQYLSEFMGLSVEEIEAALFTFPRQ